MVALLRHPAQLARLRADRGLIAAAGEEMLRYDPPLRLFALLDHAPRLALAAEPVHRPTFVLRAYTAVPLTIRQ